jgi:hypothetical protein
MENIFWAEELAMRPMEYIRLKALGMCLSLLPSVAGRYAAIHTHFVSRANVIMLATLS